MPDANQARPPVSFRRWAGLALALPAIGLVPVDSQSVPKASPALDRPADRAAESKRIAAHLERVLTGAPSPAPPIDNVAKPPDHSGPAPDAVAAKPAASLPPPPKPTEPDVGYTRIKPHFESMVAEPEPAVAPTVPARNDRVTELAVAPPTPELKPREGDRSDEVLALLKHAVAAGPAPSPAPVVARQAAAGPAAPARPPKPEFKTQPASGNRVVADAPPPTRIVPARASAGGSASDDPVEALRRELRLRDALIAELLQRVEHLEQRMVLNDRQLDQTVGGAGPISLMPRPVADDPAPTTPGVPVASTPEPAAEAVDTPDPVQTAQAQNTQTGDQAASAPPAAPGQFAVDEASAERALERTLVQEGVLLLALGEAEVDPSFTYTRRENTFPFGGGDVVAEQKVRRNEFDTNTSVRIGLPWDSQFEVDIPYSYVDQSATAEVNGAPVNENDRSGGGLGDIGLGLAKTLVQENGGWWPDVVARVTWDAPTGKTQDNGVFLGGGFNELSGSLNLVKRQDPLAFVGGVAYSKGFENDNIEPGDELGFSIGTVLAASPETSLSFIFNQTFANDTKFDGETIDGSDAVAGTFSIGAATILGPNTLLSVTGDIGLTDDAPDYAIGVSLPIRFNMPTY